MSTTDNEDWRSVTEAARSVGVSQGKISRLIVLRRLRTKKDPRDERKTLVSMQEVQKIFSKED